MAIEFDCPYCTTTIRVPDGASGKKGKCPRCETVVRVPTVEIPATTGGVAASPPSEPLEEDAAPPVTTSGQPDDDLPTRPEWMSGTAAPAPPDDPSGFVEAPPDGPPDFAALTANVESAPTDDAATPFVRTEPEIAPAQAPSNGDVDAGAVDAGEIPQLGPSASRPVSVSRKLRGRRRRRKKGLPSWTFPVVCVLVLAGGYVGYNWQSQPRLTGTLPGEAFGFLRLPSKTLDATTAGMSPSEFSQLVAALEEETLVIGSRLARVDVRGREGGLEARVVEGPDTRFVRVSKQADGDLRRYLRDARGDLNDARLDEMQSAVRAFAESVRSKGLALDDDTRLRVRNDVALNLLTDSLGAHLLAEYANTNHRCVFEDAEYVYFLLPRAAQSFVIVGRTLEGEGRVFTGRYTVEGLETVPGERPDDYVDPWTEDGSFGPEEEPVDEEALKRMREREAELYGAPGEMKKPAGPAMTYEPK